MKTFLLLFVFLLPVLSVAQGLNKSDFNVDRLEITTNPFTSYMLQIDNPCEDEKYLELKEMDLDDMSEREFEIYKQKDAACQEYLKTVLATEPANKSAESMERATNAATTYYVIAGVLSFASLIYVLTI